MKTPTTEITAANASSIFSENEIKNAENMLMILALISADYWAEALTSDHFIVNGKLHDYTIGYKNRIQKIESDPDASPISMEQITMFKTEYLHLAQEKISKYLENDIAIANLLNQTEKVSIPLGKDCDSFNFGGWDNDPWGIVAKAMKMANIRGKMNGGYTKTNITLLASDGCIHVGWFKSCRVLYRTR